MASILLRGRRRALLLGLTANVLLVATVLTAALAADSVLRGQPPFSRVSVGAGAWVSMVASYILIYVAQRDFEQSTLLRVIMTWSGLAVVAGFLAGGLLGNLSIMQEYSQQSHRFGQEFLNHIRLFGFSVLAGIVLGIPLGIMAAGSHIAEKPIFLFANVTQTIPSLALFGLLIAPLSALSQAFPFLREIGIRGIGTAPALIALTIYSLLPIVRNTYVGLHQLDPAVKDAGRGMGMSRFQMFRRIEAPLASPLVLEGVRIASVQAVGNTAIAALIGAGGLGFFIFQGLGQGATDMILLGTIPTIALALFVDTVMRTVVIAGTPKAMRGSGT
jgi:osmoprotectant transport system permease protein